jgi:DNA-binding NtrC family response regulator
MPNVLIVDDESAIRDALREILERQGYAVREASSAAAAMSVLQREAPPDVALVDLRLPDREGTAVLEIARNMGLPTSVVMISGHGTIPAAVAAVRTGAFDFLQKPLDRERLLITVRNAARQAALQRKASESEPRAFLTASPAMEAVLDEARRLASSPAPLLIQGETGSGKEVLARWIHSRSPQSLGPFVALNCAALPESLAESELFGHVKGAFTGAEAPRKGKFQAADGGTLFLDEVGDLPLPLQAKLLRSLEEGTVEPVGADRPLAVRVRVLAATHRDLRSRARDGAFREDLLFRIAGLPLRIPPLRERPEDLPLLAQHFLDEARLRQGWPAAPLPSAFQKALKGYTWPGNVRELRWAVERAALLSGPGLPEPGHLPLEVRQGRTESPPGSLEVVRQDAESRAIAEALEKARGNVAAAARLLRLSRSRLYERLSELGLDPSVHRPRRGRSEDSSRDRSE